MCPPKCCNFPISVHGDKTQEVAFQIKELLNKLIITNFDKNVMDNDL